jgi:hypothetical protein
LENPSFEVREIRRRIPIDIKRITNEDPPKEMKGSGIPFVGKSPQATPMLMSA